MNKIIKRVAILAVIFLAAVVIYFFTAFNTMEQSETVYTAMEDPTLPVVYTDLLGIERNRIAGYCQEMDISVARDTLTILPEDRKLTLYLRGGGMSPLKTTYEIRSLDEDRLVERTDAGSWRTQTAADGTEEGVLTLPIQNLLTRGTEYLLHIIFETERHGEIHYYTRILWPEQNYAADMLSLAREFSTRTLSAEDANDIVMYLESNATADNSSLGHVTLESSFSQITWAGLDMELIGDMQVTMRELDGIMGQVMVKYQVSRLSESGEAELYDVTDYYTMKWGEQRIYMMDFDRKVNQIFSGKSQLYSGRRIMLGIGNDDVVQVVKSPSERYLAFVYNRDLWWYDQDDAKSVEVFSFRGNSDPSGRSDYDRNGVRILSVKDDGEIEFLVYGYMNRGIHEGYQGISFYSYSEDGNIEEKFFATSTRSFDEISQDLEKLSYYSAEKEMVYLLQDHAVFGVDLLSKEYMVVADGLLDNGYAITEDGTRIAWQDGDDLFSSEMIHLFDMTTGIKSEIKAGDDMVLRVLGFVQEDLVYGVARKDDIWIMNGRTEDLPIFRLVIIDKDLEVQTRYETPDFYLTDIEVDDSRVHMERLIKTGDNSYTRHDTDTIVCNEVTENTYLEGVGWYASELRRKVYFVQLDKEIKSGKTVKISIARSITYDQSETLNLDGRPGTSKAIFYSYGSGQLLGIYDSLSEAIMAAFDNMGFVTDEHQRILWDRVNRETIYTIQNPQEAALPLIRNLGSFQVRLETDEGYILLDARGCTLTQILYYIGQGIPVAAYIDDDTYLLLYGYDQYNVSLLDPLTGETARMGLNEAAEYFSGFNDDYVCSVFFES